MVTGPPIVRTGVPAIVITIITPVAAAVALAIIAKEPGREADEGRQVVAETGSRAWRIPIPIPITVSITVSVSVSITVSV